MTGSPLKTGPEAVIQVLETGRTWLICAHQNPDGDAVGSVLGLGSILKGLGYEVGYYNPTGVSPPYDFLEGSEAITPEPGDLTRYDGLIVLDSGQPSRTGPIYAEFAGRKPIINIDHHVQAEDWGDAIWVDTGAPAVGLMILRLARLLDAPIEPPAALALYTAIMTDTGSFRQRNTTPEAFAAAAVLTELGADPAYAASRVYQTFSPGRIRLLARVLDGLELLDQESIALLSADRETFEETGTTTADLEDFVNFGRAVKTVEVSIMLRQEPSGYKLSFRSKGRVDVAGIARTFGGGGHKMAAGAFIEGTKAEVREKVLDAVREALHAA